MQLPFKINTAPIPAMPKVGDTNFKDHYPGINTSMMWDEVSTGARQAIQTNIIPYVGREWYDALMTQYHSSPGGLSAEQLQCLEYLQDAAANYAVVKILPQKTSTLSALGNVQQSPEGGAQPAPQWAWVTKLNDAMQMADNAMDLLLAYMEQQVQAGETDFDLWKNSNEYRHKTSDFFRLAAEMDDYLNIKNSRRTFISLVPFLQQVERRIIKKLVCQDLYADLTLPDEELSEANKLLLPMIREAVCYLGAATAIPHHRINVEGDGFRVVSFTDQYTDRRNLTNNVHESAVQALMVRCQEQGDSAIRELKQFLEDNLSDYPKYRDSSCRATPASKAHSIVQSDNGIGAVGLF